MNILYLAHTFPYPLNDGVRLHNFHILKGLAAKHNVHLLCLNDVSISHEDRRAVEGIGVRIVNALRHDVPQGFAARLCNTFFDPVPFCVRQFESRPLRAELQKFLETTPVDVVHVDYISMAPYRPLFKDLPAVFFPHDAVSMLFDRNIESETRPLRKLYTYLQWRKVKNFEAAWMPRFYATMVVSPVDKAYLGGHAPGARVAVSPNGVDADYFYPQPEKEEDDSLLFRGVMNFQPNVDAVRFFYRDVLPLIRREIPQARFYVVGKFPPDDIRAWAQSDPHLTVTDYVPDLREWTARAGVVVSPMRIGSGIKNKILESMAMAKATVATTLSCAGLELKDGEHLLVADDPADFARKTVQLLKDRSLRRRIGDSALEHVKKNYTWKKNSDDFEALYQEAVRASGKIGAAR